MQREFSISIWIKIVYFLLAAGVFGFAIYLPTVHKNPNVSPIVYPVFLVIAAIAVFMIINAFKRKIIITDDSITSVKLFETTELAIADIKGWRLGRKILVIESNTSNITLTNYFDFAGSDDILAYLKDNFNDLDATDRGEQHDNILQDTSLGFTADERLAKLSMAKKVAMVYNVLGVLVAIAALVFSQPIFIIIAIIYPLISVAVIFTSNGLIKLLSNQKKSVYPFTILGFAAPTVFLFARSAGLYHLLSYNNIWLPVIGVAAVVIVLLVSTGINKSMAVPSQIAIMVVLGIFYAFGGVLNVNCDLDKSPDTIYNARVIGLHITHGKNTSYYLYLSTWGPCHDQKQISVGSKMYYRTKIGDIVKIDFKPGLLNVPWFVLTR